MLGIIRVFLDNIIIIIIGGVIFNINITNQMRFDLYKLENYVEKHFKYYIYENIYMAGLQEAEKATCLVSVVSAIRNIVLDFH